jgi:hypothetical protein
MTPDLLAACSTTDPGTLKVVTAYLRSPVGNPWFGGVRFALADLVDGWPSDPGQGPSRAVASALGVWQLGQTRDVRQVAAESLTADAQSWQETNPAAAAVWSALSREVRA